MNNASQPQSDRVGPTCLSCCVAAWLLGIVCLDATAVAAQLRGRRVLEYGLPQVQKINEEIRQVWEAFEIRPSAAASDGQWCRRVYLDILGRIPTVEELREFTGDRDPHKKARLVDKLLDDDRYRPEYARNWTTIWTNVLIGRSGGTERNTLTSRTGMQDYLRDVFTENRPYNDMVHELVTATGSSAPGTAGFNGAVNFLAMKVNEENAGLATASTARIFLGLQVQCTQCHDHPFNEWKQQTFWEMNAFFRQTRALRRYAPGTRDVTSIELVNEDFAGEDNDGDPSEAAIYYELRNGLLRVAYPVFLDGTAIGKSGLVRDTNRRNELGNLILRSQYLDWMLVNRYWAHFLGHGFTKPIDDLGPHNPPSHPALLAYLGEQIRHADYDLKALIRWITLSVPYGLSSRLNRWNETDDPLLGEPPKFSHFYLRQMRAEELYESLLVATKAGQTRGDAAAREQTKQNWLSQFVRAFGNDEGEESTTFNGTIPQALMMFNGELMQAATRGQRGSFLWEVAQSRLAPKDQIEYLFLSGLSRKPSREERAIADRLLVARATQLAAAGSNRRQRPPVQRPSATLEALQDMWWAILNSNEFILNH